MKVVHIHLHSKLTKIKFIDMAMREDSTPVIYIIIKQ